MNTEIPTSSSGARWSWMLFDWAAQPFSTLMATFLFGPYFATAIAGDAIEGQAKWSFAIGCIGLCVALGAPVAGAQFDRAKSRYGVLFGLSLVYVVAIFATVIAAPGRQDLVWIVLLLVVVAGVAIEIATVLTNSLIPALAEPSKIGRLSANGWAMGYAGGVVALLLMIGFVAAGPGTDKTLFGLTPLIGGTEDERWGDRAVGPFSALWYLIFVAPLFLFAPGRRTAPLAGAPQRPSAWQIARLRFSALKQDPNMVRFLLANMAVKDGMIALFAIGGILGAALFGWGASELGLFGILSALTGIAGSLIGGRIDDSRGGRTVILIGLVLWLVAGALLLGLSSDRILFTVAVTPPDPQSLLSSPAEWVFLACGALVGFAAGPIQASFRSELVRLAPQNALAEYFGLLAFSGRATAFLAPFLVGVATSVAGDQKIGIAVIMVFFAIGFWLIYGITHRTRQV